MQAPASPIRSATLSDARPRLDISAAVVASCAITLTVYLATWHDQNFLVAARAVLALIPIGIAPGYVIWRHLFGLRGEDNLETAMVWLILGTLAAPPMWYLANAVGAPALFWIFITISSLLLLKHWAETYRCDDASDNRWSLIALALASAFVILWSLSADILEFRDGAAHVIAYGDHLLHAMLVAELSRSIPPEAVPFIATADQWAYHQMPDVWCDLVGRMAGSGSNDAYFHLALPLRYLFVALGCYIAVFPRFGRPAAIASMLCLLAFSGMFGTRFFANDTLNYLYFSYPTAFGLAAIFLILHVLALKEDESLPRRIALAVVLSMTLLWYKANFALVVAPAVTVVAVLILFPRRRWWWLAICVGAQTALGAARLIEISTADMRPELLLQPFTFLEWWWNIHIPRDAFFRDWAEATPRAFRPLLMLAVCVATKMHIALIAVVYLTWRYGFASARIEHAPDRATLYILIFAAAGIVFFPVQRDYTWNVSIHNMFLAGAIGLTLTGPVLVDLSSRLRRAKPAAIAVAALVAFPIVIDNAFALRRNALWGTRASTGVVHPDMLACYRFLRDHTESDALVMIPEYRDDRSSAGVLTQRRLVLENGVAWKPFFDTASLIEELDRFYSAESPDWSVLEKYDVDYVILTAEMRGASRLSLAFATPVARVYRVTKGESA